MSSYFLDSSALVKAYRQEAGTNKVVPLLEGIDQLVIACLTHVEVAATLVRRGRETPLSMVDISDLLSTLNEDITQCFEIIELTKPLVRTAVEMARKHALRGADALQLACALWARTERGFTDLIMVGSDRELNTAAQAEGFVIVDPVRA